MLTINKTKLASVSLLISSLLLTSFGTSHVEAAAPMAKFSAPSFYRVMLGDFEVTALGDGTADLPVDQLLQHDPKKTTQALAY